MEPSGENDVENQFSSTFNVAVSGSMGVKYHVAAKMMANRSEKARQIRRIDHQEARCERLGFCPTARWTGCSESMTHLHGRGRSSSPRNDLPRELLPNLVELRLSLRWNRPAEVEEDLESGGTRLIEELEAACDGAVHVTGL